MVQGHLAIHIQIYIKINQKQVTDLNVRAKTIKFLEENTGVSFVTLLHEASLDMTGDIKRVNWTSSI